MPATATVKPKTYIKKIEVDLTEEEKNQRGQELARVVQDIGYVEDEKKEVMSEFKQRLDALDRRSHELADVIRRGKENREVEVFNARNETRCLIEVCRADDGQMIESRPMTYDERQAVLFPDTVVDSAIDALEEAKEEGEDETQNTVTLSNPKTGRSVTVGDKTFKKVARGKKKAEASAQ